MKKFLMLIMAIALVFAGCGKNPSSKESSSTTQTMPEEMPKDFGFSVSFGIGKKNEINTFKDTVTKDLIEDGTITADITLTDEEMAEIYESMKEINVIGAKKFVPKPLNEEICMKVPYEEDEWTITLNGETITHAISGTYCEPTKDAKQFLELRNYVFNKVKNKDIYRKLPESTGGYD